MYTLIAIHPNGTSYLNYAHTMNHSYGWTSNANEAAYFPIARIISAIGYFEVTFTEYSYRIQPHITPMFIGQTMQFQTREVMVGGINLTISDYPGSKAIDIISSEINSGDYGLGVIDFQPGDVVVDIGAHVGIISIYLAKKYPFLDIRAYEPILENRTAFARNIKDNAAHSVKLYNVAVTSDGRPIRMIANLPDNTGGGTAQLRDMFLPGHSYYEEVVSISVAQVFARHKKIKLLKIDCEGSEHEILHSLNPEDFRKIVYLRGEFHINNFLTSKGYSIDALHHLVRQYMDPNKVKITSIRMAE